MAKKSTGNPAGGANDLPEDLSKAFTKAGISGKMLADIMKALEASGFKFAKKLKESNEIIDQMIKSESNFNNALNEAVKNSNKFLDTQLEGKELVENFSQEYGNFIKLLEAGDKEAQYAADGMLDYYQDLGTYQGLSTNAARKFAELMKEGKIESEALNDSAVKTIDKMEKTNDFLKKELALKQTIKLRVEEIRKSHDKLKDTIKQELMFAKELGKDPKLFGAFVVGQLASKLGEANQELKRIQANGATAGEAFAVMRENISLMNILGLSKVSEVSDSLIQKYGTMNAMTKEQRHTVGEMADYYGLAGDEATNLTMAVAQMPGQSMNTAKNFAKTTESVGKMKGVMPSQIMKEMAKNTQNMAIYSKGGAEGFAKAAAETKKMGLELSNVLSAAEKTLDFESSINDQMEASVLLGKEINMDRLRQAALSGDSNAIMKEQTAIMRQVGNIDNMNLLQKRALEKALGMTTEEMKKFNAEIQFQEKYFGATSGPIDNFIGKAIKMSGAIGGFIKENGLLILTLIQAGIQFATYTALSGTKTAAQIKDTASLTANSAATKLNAVQMQAYNAMRAASIPATQAMAAARAIDTANTNVNTGAENVNAASKQRGFLATVLLNGVNLVRNTIIGAGNVVLGIANGLLSVFGINTAAAGAAGTTASPGIVSLGTAIGAAGGAMLIAIPVILAVGGAIWMMGEGIGVAAEGLATLVLSLKDIPFKNLMALPLAFYGMAAGLAAMAAASSVAMPIIAALTVLGAVSAIGSINTGAGGKGEETSTGISNTSKNSDFNVLMGSGGSTAKRNTISDVVFAITKLEKTMRDLKVIVDTDKGTASVSFS